jgi:hypothetical protein
VPLQPSRIEPVRIFLDAETIVAANLSFVDSILFRSFVILRDLRGY